jgi:hypothetical protein
VCCDASIEKESEEEGQKPAPEGGDVVAEMIIDASGDNVGSQREASDDVVDEDKSGKGRGKGGGAKGERRSQRNKGRGRGADSLRMRGAPKPSTQMTMPLEEATEDAAGLDKGIYLHGCI